jgi:hypothetical protein
LFLFRAVVYASLLGPAGILYRDVIARSRRSDALLNTDAFSGMKPP